MGSPKQSSSSPTAPKFAKGDYVYFRRYYESELTGEKIPMNRVFFYVSTHRWDYEENERVYRIVSGVEIEESELRHADPLSRMVSDDPDEGGEYGWPDEKK